jgi:hypothetical protein
MQTQFANLVAYFPSNSWKNIIRSDVGIFLELNVYDHVILM